MLIRLKTFGQTSKKRYKQSLFLIPYLFTYLNAIFGFLSILKSCEQEYFAAAIYIILAALMDCFDGRLARAFGSSSYFGMELDSLCDAVSFCLAPIVLLYSWFADQIAFGGKAALVFYLCAGLARLAKFNTTSEQQSNEFIGLPTTIAAFFIATLVLSHSWITSHSLYLLLSKQILFPIITLIALLMVSKLKFYSFKRFKLYFPRDYVSVFILLMLFFWAVVHGYPLMFFMLSGYIICSLIRNFFI